MRIRSLLAALTLAALVCPVGLSAQTQFDPTETLRLSGAGNQTGTYWDGSRWITGYIGPYTVQLYSGAPGQPSFDAYCVDFFNSISIGTIWDANVSSLAGNLSLTRFGTAARTRYQKAAWLATQFATSSTSQWDALHAAIWQFMTPDRPAPAIGQTAVDIWKTAADANYAGINLDDWVVLTDVRTINGVGGTQEYLARGTVTPEPETYVMLSIGLAFIGFGLYRRSA